VTKMVMLNPSKFLKSRKGIGESGQPREITLSLFVKEESREKVGSVQGPVKLTLIWCQIPEE